MKFPKMNYFKNSKKLNSLLTAASFVAPIVLGNANALASSQSGFPESVMNPKQTAEVSKREQYGAIPADIMEHTTTQLMGHILNKVRSTMGKGNSILQSEISSLFNAGLESYRQNLGLKGFANRPSEAIQEDYAIMWRDAINSVHQFEVEQKQNKDLDLFSLMDEEKELQAKRKYLYKTTALNILLRSEDVIDLAEKVQTLMEWGADKNLNPKLAFSGSMKNQNEFPLLIVLREIKDKETKLEVLKVFLDDKVEYTLNKYLNKKDRYPGIEVTLEENKDFLVKELYENNDFDSFNRIMDAAEKRGVHFVQPYHDKLSQIKDQMICPILEMILKDMMKIREKAKTSDNEGHERDNIYSVLNLKKFEKQMLAWGDAQFGLKFQEKLEVNFENFFSSLAEKIDQTRSPSEIEGAEFKELFIEYVRKANFRNRVAKHLNRLAMSISNNAQRANAVRLIRYANISAVTQENLEDGRMFKELSDFGGQAIIFKSTNRMGWTPAMYATIQRQTQGIQLLLSEGLNDILEKDAIGNTIVHLAFPMPENMTNKETFEDSDNALDQIGSFLVSNKDLVLTEETIRAILSKEDIPLEKRIRVVTEKSKVNFTPVSLAASTGNYRTFEYLKKWLKDHQAWNAEDHELNGHRIEELEVRGLMKYRELQKKNNNFSRGEEEALAARINRKNEDFRKQYGKKPVFRYHSDEKIDNERLKLIKDPALKIIDKYINQKATKKSKKAPWSEAFKKMAEIIKKDGKKEYRNSHLFNKHPKKKGRYPLYGLRKATSSAQASYFLPGAGEIVELFLNYRKNPPHMTVEDVYQYLTGQQNENIETADYIQKILNATAEREFHALIYNKLKRAGRLKTKQVIEEENPFENLNNLLTHRNTRTSGNHGGMSVDDDGKADFVDIGMEVDDINVSEIFQ